MNNTTLALSAGFDRSLAWYQGGSVRYLVARVQADREDPSAEGSVLPANLALVIDASGSMSGAKLESAKRAASGVIDSLGANDVLSVISFASDVLVHVDGAYMDERGRADALSAVRRLETRGNTNLSDGWLTGSACVARRMIAGSGVAHRVVLMSDGQANEGVTAPTELARHAAELQARGITTSTVGIGDDYQAAVLQALAEEGGGQMHDAELAEDIVAILLGELRETKAVAVERATVTVDLPEGVEASLVGFYPSTQEPDRLVVRVGSLGTGRPRSVILKLKFPQGKIDDVVTLRVRASGRAAGTDSPVDALAQDAAMTFAHGARNTPQLQDPQLSLAVAEAWYAQVVHAVAGMNRGGERRQSRHYLERELRHFERYCRNLPGTELLTGELVLLLRHVDSDWDERTRKVMQHRSFAMARVQADVPNARVAQTWAERLEP